MTERNFFSLVSHVQTRGSAELLTTAELIKLAESCEPPPPEEASFVSAAAHAMAERSRLWLWLNDFCKPLLRELAVRLAKNTATDRTNYQQLLDAAAAMRVAQRAYFADRNRSNLRAAKEAERRFDRLMEERQQLSLFPQESDA